MDVADFELLLEEATGEDLTPFFEAQALQPGFSTWVVDSLSTGPDNGCFATTVHLHQKLRACDNFHDNEPLDVTLWNANWDTTLVHARVGGEFDEITFWHEEPFVLLGLNADGRFNQGRLDHTFAVTEPTGLTNLPWVDMRVGCDEIAEGDSILVRVEHHWAAPDQGPKASYVEELSGSHFWVVDGTWDDGAANAPLLDARFNYVGNDVNELDYDLYGETEEGGFLAWRPHAGAPWVQYPDYDWQAGSLSNGSGLFKISRLRKGHYAFAKGDVTLSVSQPSPLTTQLVLMPNPCAETLNWVFPRGSSNIPFDVEIVDSKGVVVICEPNGSHSIDVRSLLSGKYEFRLIDSKGIAFATTSFLVVH